MRAAPAPPSPGFLRVQQLSRHFDEVKAVDQVSLDIAKGEIFALLGSSGCGKSTLLRMLAGFESPTAGTIVLGGQDITQQPPYARPINMMFQSYALFPHLSVAQNIAFGLQRDGMPRPDIEARVDEMLALVQLQAMAQRKPHQLSGGQQQRVALARSLAKRPQVLLLDEPLGALDKKLREQTQLELVNILKTVGVTCVMVTHDQEEAMTMADRLAIMREGRILQMGPPQDIYETPGSRFVADFIGNVNLFEGVVTEDQPDHVRIQSPECTHHVSHGITGTEGMRVGVALRPEKIGLAHEPPAANERAHAAEVGHNQLRAHLESVQYMGGLTTYHLRCASGHRLKVTLPNAARHAARALQVGDEVWAWWDGSDVVVLTQ